MFHPRSRILPMTLAVCAALAAAPAVAGADDAVTSSVAYDGDTLVITGTAARNGLSLGVYDDGRGRLSILDSGAVAFSDPRCETTTLSYLITCAMPAAIRADMGGGDDWWASASSDLPAGTAITVAGGEGDDKLDGWAGADALSGGPGDDIVKGYAGADVLDGGDGADEVYGGKDADQVLGGAGDDTLTGDGYNAHPAPDVIDGGAGVDKIESEWSEDADSTAPVAITLGGGADDGRPSEKDDVRNVEYLMLYKGGTYIGSDADEHIDVNQVATVPSVIQGGGGNDIVQTADAPDTLDGGPGADTLDGGFGDDKLTGGPGADIIHGDHPAGDCGPVYCKLPFGNDTIDARDGEIDSVDCGVGQDTVYADPDDVVAPDCETVQRSGGGSPGGGGSGAGATGALALTVGTRRLSKVLARGLTVGVQVPDAGTLKAKARRAAKTVATGTGRAAGAGTATLELHFAKRARRELKHARTVKLAMAVTFTPKGGAALKRTVKVTLRR